MIVTSKIGACACGYILADIFIQTTAKPTMCWLQCPKCNTRWELLFKSSRVKAPTRSRKAKRK